MSLRNGTLSKPDTQKRLHEDQEDRELRGGQTGSDCGADMVSAQADKQF